MSKAVEHPINCEARIADLERQLVEAQANLKLCHRFGMRFLNERDEAQDELNAWRMEFTTTLDDGHPYQMDALEAGKMLEDAEAEARMAKQDLDKALRKLEAAEKAARTYRLMANTPASRKLADELAHIFKE